MNPYGAATRRTLATAFVLAAVTIVFGAYVRLTDAGLGCPDWPGCYGRLLVPNSEAELAPGDPNLAQRPLEVGKAWREMIHRYLASTLGLVILTAVALHAAAARAGAIRWRPAFVALLPLVVMQGVLGMWTVTLLLKPLIVTTHLLGGMAILSLLFWNLLIERGARGGFRSGPRTPWVALALTVVGCQIALGGWTSTNYAALACADFPTCHGSFRPPVDFAAGFRPWHGLGIDYEYGVLDAPARIAIHVTHRLGALVTAVIAGGVAFTLVRRGNAGERRAACVALGALGLQLGLGIANVVLGLPVPVAVAHNAVAAALLVSFVASLYHSGAKAAAGAPHQAAFGGRAVAS